MVDTCIHVTTDVSADTYRGFVASCRRALVQQSWEWRSVVTTDARDTPVYFLARDEDGHEIGALPAFECAGPHGSLLISVPQAGGYGGVIVDPSHPQTADIHQALLEAFTAEAVRRRCLLATIATPPFYADTALYHEFFAPDFVRENFFQYIYLSAATATPSPTFDVAKYVKRARQAKVKFGLTTVFTDSDAHFDAWDTIHAERMTELGTSRLPRAFLQSIREHVISAGKGFMCYVLDGDAVLAGCMFVGQHDVLDCFMLSGRSDATKTLATSVLVVDALDRARAAGYRYFNWQSSSSRESGVYQFKQKWGSLEGTHHYLTKITGDITALRHVPLDDIRAGYPWHYVMPYEQFTSHTSHTTQSAGA